MFAAEAIFISSRRFGCFCAFNETSDDVKNENNDESFSGYSLLLQNQLRVFSAFGFIKDFFYAGKKYFDGSKTIREGF